MTASIWGFMATINGTDGDDSLTGTSGDDVISGMAGYDRLLGNGGTDILDGGAGIDKMRGGFGNDTYYIDNSGDRAIEGVGEGLDHVYASFSYALAANLENLTLIGTARNGSGNSLANRIIGNDSDNIINGYAGADSMRGGAGNDTYYVDNVGDRIVENVGEGIDRVYSMVTYSATLNVDQVFLRGTAAINASGNSLHNVLVGNSAANILNGRLGADDLRGGGGADTFYFDDGHFGGLTPSTCDRILDFSHTQGDRIEFADVDANSLLADDQAFTFIGSDSFHNVAGELRYQQINGNTYVYGDINGDGLADFMIRLDGNHALTSGDILI
ncbi:MAG TPA: calcium-binding protein [Sphingomicrobium sp.]|nr:calcium-binding protein [Sphingomicrobium sp.]